MVTTIQVSEKLLNKLKERKMYGKESYEDIIWGMMEDTMELSEEAKMNIRQSEKDISEGRTVPLSAIKKKLGL